MEKPNPLYIGDEDDPLSAPAVPRSPLAVQRLPDQQQCAFQQAERDFSNVQGANSTIPDSVLNKSLQGPNPLNFAADALQGAPKSSDEPQMQLPGVPTGLLLLDDLADVEDDEVREEDIQADALLTAAAQMQPIPLDHSNRSELEQRQALQDAVNTLNPGANDPTLRLPTPLVATAERPQTASNPVLSCCSVCGWSFEGDHTKRQAGLDRNHRFMEANHYIGEFVLKNHHDEGSLMFEWDDMQTPFEKESKNSKKPKDAEPRHTRELFHGKDEWLPLDNRFTVPRCPDLKATPQHFETERIIPHGMGKMCISRKVKGAGGIERYEREMCEGEFKGGKLHGFACYWYSNGDRYEDWFKDGEPDEDCCVNRGTGVYFYKNGDKYQGMYKEIHGPRHGQGTYWYANGDVYTGQFRDDRRHGHGVQWYIQEGERYDGEWAMGEMHGKGTFFFGSGRVEYGIYSNGDNKGYSVRWSADRETAWLVLDGKNHGEIPLNDASTRAQSMGHPRDPPKPAHGTVKFRYPDGASYSGEVVHGKLEGHGTYIFPSGNRYTGEFKAGKKEGIGNMFYTDGNTFEGQFQKDRKEGEGVFRYAGGDHYIGEFSNDRRHGHGFYWYANGAVQQSRYQVGNPVGQGVWWSGDRMKAARLLDGQLVQRQGLGEAAALAVKLGFPPVPEPQELFLRHQDSRSFAYSDKTEKRTQKLPPSYGEEAMPALPPPSSGPQQAFQTEAATMETGLVVFGLAPQ